MSEKTLAQRVAEVTGADPSTIVEQAKGLTYMVPTDVLSMLVTEVEHRRAAATPGGVSLLVVTSLADVRPGDRLSWIDGDGIARGGLVSLNQDGPHNSVMVDVEEDEEPVAVVLDQPHKLWKIS